MRAPGASDLFDLGEGFYLDFPGDSLQPGCLYEQDHDRFNAGQPAVVYAHVAQQPDRARPARRPVLALLVLQRLEQQARGRLGVRPAPVPGVDGRRGARHRAGQRRLRPARGRRARRLGPTTSSSARAPTRSSTRRSGPTPATSPPPSTWGAAGPRGSAATTPRSPSTRVEPEVVVLPDAVDDPSRPARLARVRRALGRASRRRRTTARPGRTPSRSGPSRSTWHDGLRDSSFVVPTGDSQGDGADRHVLRRRRVGLGPVHQVRRLAGAGAVRAGACSRRWPCSSSGARRGARSSRSPCRAGAGPARSPASPACSTGAIPGRSPPSARSPFRSPCVALLAGAVVRAAAVHRRSRHGLGHRGHRRPARHRLDHRRAVRRLRLRPDLRRGGVDRRRSRRASGPPPATRCRRWHAGSGRSRAAFFPAALVIVVLDLAVIGIPIAIWLFVRWQFIPQVTMLEGLERLPHPRPQRRAGAGSGGGTPRSSRWSSRSLIGTVGVIVGLLAARHLHRAPAVGALGDHRRSARCW